MIGRKEKTTAELKQENKQLLAANVKLQDEALYWRNQYKVLLKATERGEKKNGREND